MDNRELIYISRNAIEKYILEGDTTELRRQWSAILEESLRNNDDDISSRLDLTMFLQLMESILKNGFNKQQTKIEYILSWYIVLLMMMRN